LTSETIHWKDYGPDWIATKLGFSWLNNPIVLSSFRAARVLFVPALDPEVVLTAIGDDSKAGVTIESARVNLWHLHVAGRRTRPPIRPTEVENPWKEACQVSGTRAAQFWSTLAKLDPGHLPDDKRGISLDGIGIHCLWNDETGEFNGFSSWSPQTENPRAIYAREVLSFARERLKESPSIDLISRLDKYFQSP
jgi:hypothetical protein